MMGNCDIILPVFYLLPVLSFVLAFMGLMMKSYKLLYPFQLMTIVDMVRFYMGIIF